MPESDICFIQISDFLRMIYLYGMVVLHANAFYDESMRLYFL